MATNTVTAQDRQAHAIDTAACDKVWSIFELREEILLHLPLKDLLLSRRVCREWAYTDRIKEALFLKRVARKRVECNWAFFEESDFDDEDEHVDYDERWEDDHGDRHRPIINPFLNHLVSSPPPRAEPGNHLLHYGLVVPINIKKPEKQLTPAFQAFFTPKASWNQMLLLQPAAKRILFFCEMEHGKYYTAPKELTIKNRDGVRMGDVVNALRGHWFKCPCCPLTYDWNKWGPDRWIFWGDDLTVIVDCGSGWETLATIKNTEEKDE